MPTLLRDFLLFPCILYTYVPLSLTFSSAFLFPLDVPFEQVGWRQLFFLIHIVCYKPDLFPTLFSCCSANFVDEKEKRQNKCWKKNIISCLCVTDPEVCRQSEFSVLIDIAILLDGFITLTSFSFLSLVVFARDISDVHSQLCCFTLTPKRPRKKHPHKDKKKKKRPFAFQIYCASMPSCVFNLSKWIHPLLQRKRILCLRFTFYRRLVG